MSFWDDLLGRDKPIIGLAPMDGVTDAAMRYMTAKYGKPDVIFSEFVSVDALHYAKNERRERLLKTFIYDEIERPIVAQVFGNKPEFFAEAAELVEKLGFDGIDINMGCPAHKVEENGAGAGLIRTPKLTQEIVLAVKSATKLPVSVKTRIGVDKDVAEAWMESLMEVRPAMISLHGRTLKQLYQGRADWEAIARAAKVVHKHGGHILGNGDIESIASGKSKVIKYKVDGFLIGRAAEGNPGVFVESQSSDHSPIIAQGSELWKQRQLTWMVEHAKIYEKLFTERDDPLKSSITLKDHPSKSFMPMRKHLAWYCKGFPGASELRTKLVQANSAAEVEEIMLYYQNIK